MCGIIGYVGSKKAAPVLLKGLERLEYRGYDSSGIAVADGEKIEVIKSIGKINELVKKASGSNMPCGQIGIGHTRWATHGVPSDINSHPHLSEDGAFAIVHNGIIENYAELKAELISRGVHFASDTDSEVIAQLLQDNYDGDIISTLRAVAKRLVGSYAVGIVTVYDPDALYAIRKDNPLVVGVGKNENFIASDFAAALEHTHNFVQLENGETARLSSHSVTFYDSDGNNIQKTPYRVDWDIESAEKSGYPHFMLKEIYEQPRAITDTVRPRIKGENGDKIVLDKIEFTDVNVNRIERIDIVGCGSAYHAGIVGKSFIEKYCRIRVNCELASEYVYSDPITDNRTLTIIISQSGETADTLAALRLAKKLGSHTIAVVNVVESAIAREADDVLYTHAGPEIAVATTKGYTTQVAALYLIGLKIAKIKHTISDARYLEVLKEIAALPKKIEAVLKNTDAIESYAKQYAKHKCVFFIGRGTDYAASLEGALKLKEISYIHAEAYAAGELKHGTISLIEDGTITLALVTQSALYLKMLSNIKAVQSRGGTVLAIASKLNEKIGEASDGLLVIPDCDDDVSPVITAVVLQLFAYYVAKERGCDIDKPRNLAKSVTVE
ncbi:MAG: glutamine--fructose-6-phosphate transaminase (isomerizing) [Clostridiales bacterium]|nr:glutamine--fructose-6-phosphate transaminase (isomerizing) [Clostridiales bacterium]